MKSDPVNVYCICEDGATEAGPCKIGIAKNVGRRLGSLQAGNWRKLVVAWQVQCPDEEGARNLEQLLLGLYRPNPYGRQGKPRLPSEWVSVSPNTAWEWASQYSQALNEYEGVE